MRAWLEVDLASVVANARTLAARVAPAALCAVVKSNAYGHGLVPVSRALAGSAISGLRFAVFTFGEALALAEAGLRQPILVLGPVEESERASVRTKRDLFEFALLDQDDVGRFSPGTKVHVKIDSGVGRFGVRPDAAPAIVAACGDAGLRVVGMYSHLANAEDLDERFTLLQVGRLLSSTNEHAFVVHIAASAAAIMYPQTRLDMVRCGIALYGRWPSQAVASSPASRGVELAPALRWRAPIVQLRDVAAGDPVGYGCDFVPQRASRIAVLPLGYADGLPRAAGNGRMRVGVGGSSAPIVGRICMNACMVDFTDLADSRQAIGRGVIVDIDVDEAARAADTINYEILARLPEALERRYS